MKRAVFFDRDGVLNEAIVREGKAHAPVRLEEFRLVPDLQKQIDRVRKAGLLSLVFTNQPALARRELSWEALEAMHRRLASAAEFDGFYVCPHDPHDSCRCHKPEPGMLLQARTEWALDLKACFVIGDRWRDIGAGKRVGCFSILIDRPYSRCSDFDAKADDLEGAVSLVLEKL